MRRTPLLLALATLSLAQTPLKTLALQTTTAHVQGIDTDGAKLWVTSVDRGSRKGFLQEFTVSGGRLLRTIELQDHGRFHPGGIAIDETSIWIPIAEYRANSTAVIQRRNLRTLALEAQFMVDDHIGCVAVTPEFIIGGNWDSRDLYFWDHAGKLIRKIANQTGNSYQDIKYRDGLIVASGTLTGAKAAVDWLDIAGKLVARHTPGNTDRGQPLTREGMTVFGNQLWLLPEDGASRLFIFDLPRAANR
ncbi:MAG: DUF6454 family protein [Candidatus Solibacter sp.]